MIYGHRGSHREVSANGQSRGWLNGDVVGVGVDGAALCDITQQHNTSSCRMITSNTFIVVCNASVLPILQKHAVDVVVSTSLLAIVLIAKSRI